MGTDSHTPPLVDPIDMGLFDSDTGASLKASKVVDVTGIQRGHDRALLVFTEAARGRIVQIHLDSLRIHYFIDEPSGREMIAADAARFGFKRSLLQTITANAPPRIAAKASAPGGTE